MDHARVQDIEESEETRPIRRVQSPSGPRAWRHPPPHKPRVRGGFYKHHFPRDVHSIHKGRFKHKYQNLKPYHNFHPREYFPPKPPHFPVREKVEKREDDVEIEREVEWQKNPKGKEHFELREIAEERPPTNQNNPPVLLRPTSNRDKDTQFTVVLGRRNQSSERDQRATKSKERDWSTDMELPLTASQTAARDRAIQQKRREIDEVYYQECEMFGLVVKMLIAKDPSLEGPIQSSLQENLREIGKRCVDAMEKFIKEYDSRSLMN